MRFDVNSPFGNASAVEESTSSAVSTHKVSGCSTENNGLLSKAILANTAKMFQ
jgi:hypothetical protein